MSYFPITSQDRAEMLETIGVEQEGQLFGLVPESLRNPRIELAPALSELEAQRWFRSLAAKNVNLKTHVSFLGAGCYEHFIPSVIRHMISRGEFYTSYTPYQPEASQGTLQALFEYQSFICELTGMDVSNGSHYDGATALAEAVFMAFQETKRRKVLVARSLHPDYTRVIRTYLGGTNYSMEVIGFGRGFELDLNHLKRELAEEIAAVVVASPNFFGLVEDLTEVERLAHQNGSLLIMTAHPLSFGFYKTPQGWGADIVAGEGQSLGMPPSFGGPWLGYLAARRALMRRMPGRLVGFTHDSAGRRAFCLTLQAREQHIRRERASSNICTNQALCAIAASIYLAAVGKTGVRRIAELNMENAFWLRSALDSIPKIQVLTRGPIFNEFVIQLPRAVQDVTEALFEQGILAGLALDQVDPEWKDQMLLCATEVRTTEELDRFVKALKGIVG